MSAKREPGPTTPDQKTKRTTLRKSSLAMTLVPQLNEDIDNVKKYAIMARRSKALLHLDFDCISPQTLTRREEY